MSVRVSLRGMPRLIRVYTFKMLVFSRDGSSSFDFELLTCSSDPLIKGQCDRLHLSSTNEANSLCRKAWLHIQIGIRSTTWSERQYHHFPEYRPGTKFKSVFALILDQEDDSTIFPNIDLALYSNRYSNRYSLYYIVRKTIAPFSRISTWFHIQIDIRAFIRSQ